MPDTDTPLALAEGLWLRLRNPHLIAQAVQTGARLRVLAGAQGFIALKTIQSANYKQRRQDLFASGVFQPIDDQPKLFVTTEDLDFANPSEAATVLLGYQANGLNEWVTTTGKRPTSPRQPSCLPIKRRLRVASELEDLARRCEAAEDPAADAWQALLRDLAGIIGTPAPETPFPIQSPAPLVSSGSLQADLLAAIQHMPNTATAKHSPHDAFEVARIAASRLVAASPTASTLSTPSAAS